MTLNSCPEHIHEVPCSTHHFWGTRDELSVENGLLLKGNRICIPHSCMKGLSELHKGHNDTEKMQHLMRDSVCWLGMDANIAEYIKQCRICTQFKATQVVQPMLHGDIPEGPWQDLTTDFFKHNNAEYLIIVDTFSKYPFIFKTTSKTVDTIIHKF